MKKTCGLTDAEIIGMLLRENKENSLEELEGRVNEPKKVYEQIKFLMKGGIIICLISKNYPNGAYQLTTFGKEIIGVNIK